MEKLKHPNVIRTDRSYAVNVDKVVALDGNTFSWKKMTLNPLNK